LVKARVELGGWEEHWERVRRWHVRLKRICNGLPKGVAREDAIDEVLAFFPTCYHLRDSLIQSGHKPQAEVDAFIRKNDALALCRDLATAVKHFEITHPYRPTRTATTTAEPLIVRSGMRTPCEPAPGEQWSVETDAGRKDMFELADECVEAWRTYLFLS
jgi:hypothetical protein